MVKRLTLTVLWRSTRPSRTNTQKCELTCLFDHRTSLVAQMVKHLSTMWETRVQSLSWEDPLEKEMPIHSRTIAWKIPWTEDPGRLQSMGLPRVGHSFDHRGLECKSGKSRDTWSNRQIWYWSVIWRRAKANTVIPRECSDHSKYPLPTTQEKTLHMDITRWSILKSDWSYSFQSQIEKLHTVSKIKTGSWLWLRSWTPYCQIQT